MEMNMTELRNFEPHELQAELEAGRCVLVDVREAAEHAAERIPGSILCSLSDFDPARLPQSEGRPVILHCGSGARSERAFNACCEAGVQPAGHLKGGIQAWKRAGLSTATAGDSKPGMTVQQAVMAMASAFVLVFLGLAAVFSPWWMLGAAAVSTMLLQAAFTGFCPASRVFLALGFRPA
jgi:rhodanese-related sulfurtransferase